MATIIIRNSTGSGAVPSSLVQGELAINTIDGKLFYGSGSGNIVKEFTASNALTASYVNPLVQNVIITGSLNVSGSARFGTGFTWDNTNATLNITSSVTSVAPFVRLVSNATTDLGGVSIEAPSVVGAWPLLKVSAGGITAFQVDGGKTTTIQSAATATTATALSVPYGSVNFTSDVASGTVPVLLVKNTGSYGTVLKLDAGSTFATGWYLLDVARNGTTQFSVLAGSNTIVNTGNLLVGNTTGTARLTVKGSGATSATTALRVENTNASASLVVLDNGFVGINTGSAQFNLDVNGTARVSGNIQAQSLNTTFGITAVDFGTNSAFAFSTPHIFAAAGSAPAISSGIRTIFLGSVSWLQSSGSAEFAAFRYNGTINQTGTATGITRGLYINPTLTSAFDFRAIEVASGASILNGVVAINSTNISTGYALFVNGVIGASSLTLTQNLTMGENFAISNNGSQTIDIDANNDTTNAVFRVTANGTANELFRVNETGSFGIGTIAPSAQLHVSASTSDAAHSFLVQNSLGQALISVQNNRTVSINAANGTNGATTIGTTTGGITFNSGYNNTLIGNALTFYSGNNHSTIQGWSSPTSGIAVGYAQTNVNPNTGSVFTVKGAAETSGSGVLFVTGSSATRLLTVASETSSSILVVSGSGNIGIGTSNPGANIHIVNSSSAAFRLQNIGGSSADFSISAGNGRLEMVGNNVSSGRITIGQFAKTVGINQQSPNAALHVVGSGTTSATTAFLVQNSTPTTLFQIQDNGLIGINRTPTASLDVAGITRLSGSFNTAASGSILTVIGSGSAQPIFTVQGSQGELFSITDSLSGSLFSVNDISGLPILEVFSDNTTLIGDYQDPMLITTRKVTMTNSGSFIVYSLPTASYDTAFFDYSIKSGSNARAGQIMAIQSGSSVNFTETTTTDFGSTTAVSFTVLVSGSNMVLTGSAATGSWTIKTIVRGL